ncbi:hypothetical protein [uncultured Muribaculum sp.]|uniref:hypothetical protein n=1 Tax=uncultured Muribaculum sp. TaxID=1918613 RepID=UPI0025D28D2B|nr:hypothetical protein [uncultured Muribaculum sp.]
MPILTLTLEEMMSAWRLRAFPEAVNDGCVITRCDGIDLDAHLQARMQAWYDALLRDATLDMLAPVDISADVEVDILSDGTGWFTLPDEAVRLVSLMMPGWSAPALIIPDATLPGASLQLSGRQRSDHRVPVAVVDGRTVRVCSPPPTTRKSLRPLSCLAILDTPGLYRLHSRALSTIPLLL